MKAKDRGAIPKHAIEAARRKIKRRVASVLIRCMAEEDMGFEQIANRLDQPTETVRKWVYDLAEGIGKDMNEMSDLALAMDCEIEFGARKVEYPQPKTDQPAETQ
jgi:predicted DNA-binding protein